MIRTPALTPRVAIWGGAAAILALAAAIAVGTERPEGLFLVLLGVTSLALAYIAWVSDPAWAFSGAIALSVFSGNWGYFGVPFGPDRALFIIGILAVLCRAPGVQGRPRPEWRGVHWVLAAALVWTIGSALLAGTLRESEAFFALLDQFGVIPFAAFFLGGLIFPGERQRQILLGALVATGGYLGLTALFETLKLRALVVPSYILDPTVGLHAERARGPFVEAVAMGQALFACGVAAAIAVTVWRGRWPRAFAGAVVVLCALGTLFTLTRSIWVASAISVLMTMVVVRELRRYVIPTAIVGALAVGAALIFIPGLSSSAEQRQADERPIWDRYNTNDAALRMVEEQPLAGFGWGRFERDSIERLRQSPDYPLTGEGIRAHNVPLLYASEIGLVGVTLWIVAFLVAIVGTVFLRAPPEVRRWQIGLMAITIHFLIVANFVPLAQAFPNMVLWLWAGLVYGACRPYGRRSASSES